jgi:hypothetical protein
MISRLGVLEHQEHCLPARNVRVHKMDIPRYLTISQLRILKHHEHCLPARDVQVREMDSPHYLATRRFEKNKELRFPVRDIRVHDVDQWSRSACDRRFRSNQSHDSEV